MKGPRYYFTREDGIVCSTVAYSREREVMFDLKKVPSSRFFHGEWPVVVGISQDGQTTCLLCLANEEDP